MLVLSPKTCPLLWDRPISFLWWWWSGGGVVWLLTDGPIPVLALLGQMSPCLSPGKTPTPHFPSVT